MGSLSGDDDRMSEMKGSILVVDDEERQREILQTILKDEGYSVATAVSGEHALRQMKNCRFDMVLTDLKMPGLPASSCWKRSMRWTPPSPWC